MKNIPQLLLLFALLAPLSANAATICGKVFRKSDQLAVHDRDSPRNSYRIASKDGELLGRLETYENSDAVVCLTGDIGPKGDADVLEATELDLIDDGAPPREEEELSKRHGGLPLCKSRHMQQIWCESAKHCCRTGRL